MARRLPSSAHVHVIIGVDVGGTAVSAGLVTADGEILTVLQSATHRRGPGTALETVLEAIDALVAEAGARDLHLAGIGVGVPGVVDPEHGMMFGCILVPELSGVPLAERICVRTGLPTWVDNDVNALALAEWRFGAGRQAAAVVVLAVGSGIGGGVILDGRLVRGRNGHGGELGHLTVKLDGPPCFCGGRGCVTAYLGGRVLEREARARLHDKPDSLLLGIAGGDPDAISCEMIFAAAAAGDAIAGALVDEGCEALAAAIGGIVNSLNPDVIVVTGGVARSLVGLEADLIRRTSRYAIPRALAATRITLVPADKTRTVLGGVALVLYEQQRASHTLTPLAIEPRA